MIVETHVVSLLVGMVCGVIEAWNKKAMFGVWLLAVIYTVFTKAEGANLRASDGISNWFWLSILASFAAGMALGKSTYEQAFKKE